MYEMAKKAREKMKAKAKSLANPGSYAKDQRVDSSDWSPAEPMNGEAKTGMRPISRRQYKKGGRVEKDIGVGMANKDMREANKDREGVKHVGGFKKGGEAKACWGGKMKKDSGGQVLSSAASKKDTKERIGTEKITPVRAKAEHYKKGGKVRSKHADGERVLPSPEEAIGSEVRMKGLKVMPSSSDSARAQVSPSQLRREESYTDADMRASRFGRKAGGKAKHPDVKEDKALVRKMVKKDALTGKKDGGATGEKWIQKAIKHKGALHKQLGVPAGEKIPAKKLEKAAEKGGKLGKRARLAETLKRMNRAEGGGFGLLGEGKKKSPRGKAGKTDIHINVIAGQRPSAPMPTGMATPTMPTTPMPPVAPAAAAPASLPMARKAGGRITKIAKSYKDMEAGAGSGEGRLQKTDIAKLHKDAPARKAGGKVRGK